MAARGMADHALARSCMIGRVASGSSEQQRGDHKETPHQKPGAHRYASQAGARWPAVAPASRGRNANQWARGCADVRGPGGRARAIRAALAGGYDEAGLTDALAAGDVRRDQLRLDLWPLAPA